MNRSSARRFVFSLFAMSCIWSPSVVAQSRTSLSGEGVPVVIVPPQVLSELSSDERKKAGWDRSGVLVRDTARPAPLQVGSLGAIETGMIGLERGYGPDVWRGSRSAYIIQQLSRLPNASSSYVLSQMELAILRGRAPVPKGATPSDVGWFQARLARLYGLGDLTSVSEFIALTGAEKRNAAIAQINIKALLDSGDIQSSCLVPLPRRMPKRDLFFTQHKIICALNRNDRAEAALTIDLNRELLSQDPFFEALAYMVTLDAPMEAPALPLLIDSLDFALIKIAKIGYGNRLQAHSVSRYPTLARDYDVDPVLQLEAARGALKLGLIKPDMLREIVRLVALTPAAPEANFRDIGAASALPEAGANNSAPVSLEPMGNPAENRPALVFGGDDLLGLAKNFQIIAARQQALQPSVIESFLLSGVRANSWQFAVTLMAPDILAQAQNENVVPSDVLALASLTLGRIDIAEKFLTPRNSRPNAQPTYKNIYDVVDFAAGRTNAFPNIRQYQESGQLLAVEPTLMELLIQAGSEPQLSLSELASRHTVVERTLRLSQEGRLGDLVLHLQETIGSKPVDAWLSHEAIMAVASLTYLGLEHEAQMFANELIFDLAVGGQLKAIADAAVPFALPDEMPLIKLVPNESDTQEQGLTNSLMPEQPQPDDASRSMGGSVESNPKLLFGETVSEMAPAAPIVE